MAIPVTIYAHENQGVYTYVGASTNLSKRWPGVPCVILEVTDLEHQVERETWWLLKLRMEGHPLRNRVKPGRVRPPKILKRSDPPTPDPNYVPVPCIWNTRKEFVELLVFADFYEVHNPDGVKAAKIYLSIEKTRPENDP